LKHTGRPLFEAFGMSEISTYVSSSPTVPIRRGSPGKPQPGRVVTILDGGLIAVHRNDPGLLLQYWNRPEEDALVWKGGWFAGGDLGRIDQDGYVWLEGRADEIMNAGGFRVSPIEVENVLAQHADVAEAGVCELRVSEETTIIAALVVPAPGRAPAEQTILAFAQERLAAYKCPKLIRFVQSLPRTTNGKLIRKALGA
jgi:acyl-coenzyme A synthetase/AMP-(fatty) acid ligase